MRPGKCSSDERFRRKLQFIVSRDFVTGAAPLHYLLIDEVQDE